MVFGVIKKVITIMFCFAFSCSAFADVNYINIKKITKNKKLIADFKYIKDNLSCYKNWTLSWNYVVTKEELVRNLKSMYEEFLKLDKNYETFLLLGDMAHYLYNLDASDEIHDYNKIAISNYNDAIELNKTDYRAYWFLGTHYSQIPGDYLIKGVNNFEIAEKMKNKKPSEFWDDYAQASIFTAMPSHYIYAVDKAKNIEKPYKKDKFLVSLDKNKEYDSREMWNVSKKAENNFFISRALGMGFILSPEECLQYSIQITNYKKNGGAFVLVPPELENQHGQKISYTIFVAATTVNGNMKLEAFINDNTTVKNAKDKSKVNFSSKYDKTIAYEIKDENLYADIGGAHIYVVVIERDYPKYAGLFLETPSVSKSTYFALQPQSDRFAGKIFYTVILDTCEDIYDSSFEVFKDFFENKMIIE